MSNQRDFTQVQREHLKHMFGWVVVGVFAYVIFYVFLFVDLLTRWGRPLVLDLTWPTIIWLAAFLLNRLSRAVVKSATKKVRSWM